MDAVIRAAVVYAFVLLVFRAAGRRTLSELTGFDFVLLLIIGESTQQALLGDDFSITNAVLLIVTLFGIDIGLSYLKEYWPGAAKAIDGQPTMLIAEGEVDRRALKRARVDVDDIMSAARETQGLERLDQIRHAILETNGGISIVPAKST